jgi:hypothetical protein
VLELFELELFELELFELELPELLLVLLELLPGAPPPLLPQPCNVNANKATAANPESLGDDW